MLLRQRELRARVIRLLGHERLAETTRALDEAGLLWGLVAAAAAWPLVVAGVVAPKAAVFLLAFVPLSGSVAPCFMRAIWIVRALLVPLAVGDYEPRALHYRRGTSLARVHCGRTYERRPAMFRFILGAVAGGLAVWFWRDEILEFAQRKTHGVRAGAVAALQAGQRTLTSMPDRSTR